MKKGFHYAFLFVSVIHLYAVAEKWQSGIYVTKPLLMTFLAAWFYLSVDGQRRAFTGFLLTGILFSIAGDTFMMFVEINPSYFLMGLGCFLMTHLLYIVAFFKYDEFRNGLLFRKKWMVLPVLLYLGLFNFFLWPDLPDEFLIPVLIYSLVISAMLISCINMSGRVGRSIVNGLIGGAILFVISDSLIAVNKFKTSGIPTVYMGLLIMTTYISGQYLIVRNAIRASEGG